MTFKLEVITWLGSLGQNVKVVRDPGREKKCCEEQGAKRRRSAPEKKPFLLLKYRRQDE